MAVTPVRTLLALTAAGAVALAGASAGPAMAGKKNARSVAKVVPHCTGSKLESKPLTGPGGKTRGHVELWYSSADGGTNCVITYDDASGSRLMSATLVVQDRNTASDTKTYEHYAGGAAVTQTNGKCVQWGGYVFFGKKQFGYINDRWTHCR